MIFHNEPLETIFKEFNSNSALGLTIAQADSALQHYGENRLKEGRKKTFFERFIEQFKDAMILILIAAAIVSFTIACIEQNPKEFFEPILILLIVILNAIMANPSFGRI